VHETHSRSEGRELLDQIVVAELFRFVLWHREMGELIAKLMRLSEESPRRSATEVLLRNEGFMEIEDASLGRAQSPSGRWLTSPVVILQAGTAPRSPMRMPGGGVPEEES